MTDWPGKGNATDYIGKTSSLPVVILIILLLVVPIDSFGKTFFGSGRSDSTSKEDASLKRRTGETQSTGDEDETKPKKRKSGQTESGKWDDSLKRKAPVAQKETVKQKDKKRDESRTETSAVAKTRRVSENVFPPVTRMSKSPKYRSSIDFRGTVKRHENELEQAIKKGDSKDQKNAHTDLGQTYYFTGQYKRAAEHHSKAAELARRSGIPKDRGFSLHHLAATWLAMANYRTAARYGNESLRSFQQAGDTEGVATAYNDLAQVEKNKGQFRKAAQNYEKALDANKEKNQLRFVTLTNLGELCLAWGDYKKAVDYYKEALESAESTKNPSAEGDTLINIAKVYAEWGRHDEALQHASEGLQALIKTKARTELARKVIGDLYMDAGQMKEAEPYVKAAGFESSLGRFYLLRSQFNDARVHYEKLKESSDRDGDLEDAFTALTGLGRIAESLKDYAAAENYYAKAVNVTEQMRSTLLLAERRNFFAATINGFPRAEPAKGLVRVTLKLNKPEQSLYASELVRARSFADNLTEKTDGHNFNVPNDVLEKEEELTDRLASLMNGRDLVPKSADKERFDEISTEISSLETDRNTFLQMLWSKYPAYASAKYPRPITLRESAISPDE